LQLAKPQRYRSRPGGVDLDPSLPGQEHVHRLAGTQSEGKAHAVVGLAAGQPVLSRMIEQGQLAQQSAAVIPRIQPQAHGCVGQSHVRLVMHFELVGKPDGEFQINLSVSVVGQRVAKLKEALGGSAVGHRGGGLRAAGGLGGGRGLGGPVQAGGFAVPRKRDGEGFVLR
jgi:hypothetical protein